MWLHWQSHIPKRRIQEVTHTVTDTGGDDIILWFILLQHRPHGFHIITGESPIAACFQIAKLDCLGEAELDACDSIGDLAADEFQAATRGFMVKTDARAGKNIITLTVIDGDPM